MKTLRLALVALLAMIGFFALPQASAEADHLRWMPQGYFPPPPPRRVYRYYPDIYEDDFYADDYDDDVYYSYEEPEPRYEPKPRKKKKKSTASAPSKVKPQTAAKPKKPTKKPAQTASVPKPKKTTASAKTTNSAAATASANVSCDKAKSIVTGYGFSDIQTMSCAGSVYSFAANRGGKSFAVKVSALNGELTVVKRQ